jgi:hypothetical protein
LQHKKAFDNIASVLTRVVQTSSVDSFERRGGGRLTHEERKRRDFHRSVPFFNPEGSRVRVFFAPSQNRTILTSITLEAKLHDCSNGSRFYVPMQ